MSHQHPPMFILRFLPFALWGVIFALVGKVALTARAQCDGQWIPGEGVAGTDNLVAAMTLYDPDGPGPLGLHVAMAGRFRVVGKTLASRVALYDLSTQEWRALGAGLNGSAYAIAVLPNNELVVGGQFTSAGGVAVSNVAKWNGTSWEAMGSLLNGQVSKLLVMPNGDLIAGGQFTSSGLGVVNGIARWSESDWVSIGGGVGGQYPYVSALEWMPNGDLIAGGIFASAGGVPANHIARWDGSRWWALGTGVGTTYSGSVSTVRVIKRLSNDDLIVGGSFYTAGGIASNLVARWNGGAWSAVGGGLGRETASVGEIAVAPNGDLYVGGGFGNNNGFYTNLERWNGSNWSGVGGGVGGGVSSLVFLPSGELCIGGSFSEVGAFQVYDPAGPCVPVSNIVTWNGASWSVLGSGFTGWISTLLALPDGDLLAGGRCSLASDLSGMTVARRTGTRWSAIGSAVYNHYMTQTVDAMAVSPSGDIYVGGYDFLIPNWTCIARVTPAGWVGVGAGLTGFVNTMAFIPGGDLVAGGNGLTLPGGARTPIARWNGNVWSAMGTKLTGNGVENSAILSNGDLIVSGSVSVVGGDPNLNLARWNGNDWESFASPSPGDTVSIGRLLALSGGRLLAYGSIRPPGGTTVVSVLLWNGTTWSRIGGNFNGSVVALAVLPSGAIVAGGQFTAVDGVSVGRIARWTGSAWVPMGSGIDSFGFPPVRALATLANGDLAVAGEFSIAGGNAAGSIAIWREDRTLPTIASHPADQRPCNNGSASFSVIAQSDTALSYRWRHDSQPIDTSVNPSAATATLTIAHAMIADAGLYDCVVTSCGSVTSNSARLRACVSDFNCDGAIDFFDFDDFVVCFEGIACPPGISADFDRDGTVDFFDYDAFISAFESPC